MSVNLVRQRFRAFAVKIETTLGADAMGGTPGGSDWFPGDLTVTFDQNASPNNEATGSLDSSPAIVGGLKPMLRFTTPLRGSGTAGTAPDFGKLLRCCTMQETITASAVGAPTAATAGTVNSATLATPFAATAQLYRGMPLLLSGDRAKVAGITDYTAGRVASVGHTESVAMTTTTLAQVPINVLYSPTSDESVYKSATIYAYRDGLRWRFTGFVGTASLVLNTAGVCELQIEGRAQLAVDPDAVALPAGALGIVRPTPPRFVGGLCQLNRLVAQVRQVTLALGVQTVLPDNPEALEGYDPAVAISRDITGSLDPYMNVTSYVSLFSNFRQGVAMPFQAVIGSTVGNRFVVTVPLARATQMNPGDREGLGTNAIQFQADGPDSGFFLAAF